ncbi:MAG: GTPase Era [Bacteroidetes bacterium]|nr:MAG: GTPase Era [Bacteroidota bacterium]
MNNHRAGYVTIIGNPNVGKSTLLNALLGEQLSIITPKAQTTRHRILGMLNGDDYQIVFSDTPGIIKPAYAMQEGMMDFVKASFEDADVFLYLVEPGIRSLKDDDLFEKLKKVQEPLFIIVNKIDKIDQAKLEEEVNYWHGQFPNAAILPLSALKKVNVDMLKERLSAMLPVNPPFFDKEDLSDKSERFFVEEMVREQILLNYSKEIPYAVEVEVEEFKEEETIIRIRANIYTERNTQKGIIVGAQGSMIKKTGTGARKRMEIFFKKKVFLDLFVKVRKNWRSNDADLKRFGYKR